MAHVRQARRAHQGQRRGHRLHAGRLDQFLRRSGQPDDVAFLLPNRHAGQTDPALLVSCFTRSLEVAAGLGAASLAFPAVSAGVYGWDVREVARIAVAAVSDAPAPGVDDVRFVLFSADALAAFEEVLRG